LTAAALAVAPDTQAKEVRSSPTQEATHESEILQVEAEGVADEEAGL